MSAQAGWYPDPGGGQGLYRYWDGRAWSAATSPNPAAPPPAAPLGSTPPAAAGHPYASVVGQPSEQLGAQHNAYANYQAAQGKRKTPLGWWLGAAALLTVIILVSAFVIRGVGGASADPGPGRGEATTRTCPQELSPTAPSSSQPADGRVHGGPVSYPRLGPPWGAPSTDFRVPFGVDAVTQTVLVEPNYAPDSSWVASVLVGELQAGDGFFTPEQGAQIVVRCILGRFYGDAEVESDVKVNKAATIDGRESWIVESQLSFDIPNLRTKGELLIVAIIATGSTAGLYYASIPDTRPELVAPARAALAALKVDG